MNHYYIILFSLTLFSFETLMYVILPFFPLFVCIKVCLSVLLASIFTDEGPGLGRNVWEKTISRLWLVWSYQHARTPSHRSSSQMFTSKTRNRSTAYVRMHMRMYALNFTRNVKGYEALAVDTNVYDYLDLMDRNWAASKQQRPRTPIISPYLAKML